MEFISSIRPVPYGLEKSNHVDPLRLHLDHPWVFRYVPGCGSSEGIFLEAIDVVSMYEQLGGYECYSPAINEILKVVAPLQVAFGLILQFRYGLTNNVCEKIDESSSRLHVRPISWEGKAVLCDF